MSFHAAFICTRKWEKFKAKRKSFKKGAKRRNNELEHCLGKRRQVRVQRVIDKEGKYVDWNKSNFNFVFN